MEVDGGILVLVILEGLESLESLVNLRLDRTYFKLPDSDNTFFEVLIPTEVVVLPGSQPGG